jgi:hypothetical protein
MASQPIKFVFEGDTTDLEKALAQVGKQFDKTDDKAKKTGLTAEKAAKAAKVGMLAAAAAAAALTVAFAKTASAALDLAAKADKIAKSAAAVGTSAEEFQKVVGAFELGGLQAEATEAAIKKLGLRIGQVAAGAGGPAAEAFEKLNITAAELEALPLAERMAVIADRVAELGTQSQRATVLNALFEESGLQMAGAFAQGGDAIRDAAQQIEDAGLISNEVAKQAEAMSDAVTLAKRAWEGLKTEALAPLIPAITIASKEISKLLIEIRKTKDVEQFGEIFITTFLDVIAPAVITASQLIVNSLAAIPVSIAAAEVALLRLKQTAQAIPALLKDTFSLGGLPDRMRAEFDALMGGEFIRDISGVVGDETLAISSEIAEAESVLTQSLANLAAVQDMSAGTAERARQALRNIREELGQTKEAADEAGESIGEMGDNVANVTQTITGEGTPGFKEYGAAISEVIGSIGSLFSQVQANVQESISESEKGLESINDRLAESTDEREIALLEKKKKLLSEQLKEQKEAALVAFGIQKAASLSQAAIATALAVMTGFAQGGPALAAAAGIAGGISIAAIAAEPPPSFHVGGMVAQAAPDEINARLLRSEAVLSPQGVNAVGGEEGVRQLNRGMGGAGQPIVSVLQVRSRTVDAMISDNLRTKQGPLVDALRAARPRALGRHNPFASS